MENRISLIFPCSMASLVLIILAIVSWFQRIPELSFLILWLLSAGWVILALFCLFTDIKKSGISIKAKLAYPSFCIILAIWLIRFAVGLNCSIYENISSMNWLERFLDSLIHALQTFSMDEDYTMYLSSGKAFLYSSQSAAAAELYGFYAAVLNTLAPIAGGAILFDILSDIFPNFRLYYHTLRRNKKNYIFSELNSRAVVLAEDIRKKEPNAFILFTDAYVDPENELSSELFIRAKKINALCVTTDLTALNGIGHGLVEYYLIDNSDESNIEALTKMFSGNWKDFFIDKQKKSLWKSEKKTAQKNVNIFIFSENPTVYQIAEHYNRLCTKENVRQVLIQVVNEYENLVYELLDTHPLYLPLLDTHGSELSVVLTGSGSIGKQFIKSAYWCGQMLNPFITQSLEKPEKIKLHFHIISDNSTEFKQQLKLEMPEVFDRKYCETDEKTCTGTLPYASFSFHDADVNSYRFQQILDQIPQIDYVLIAFDNDRQNLTSAHWLKEYLDKRSLIQGNHSHVHCIIEDTNLKQTITNIYQENHAFTNVCFFGSLDERYNYNTIHQTRFEDSAFLVDMSHNRKEKRDFLQNMYNYRSSLASAMYLKYRLFSAGLMKQNDHLSLKNLDGFFRYLLNPENANLQLWCEKQRWNAYVRSIGFSCPDTQQFLNYYRQYHSIELHKAGSEKKNFFHLHSCLVECDAASGIVLNDRSLLPHDSDIICTAETRSQDLMEILDHLANEQNYDRLNQRLRKTNENLSQTENCNQTECCSQTEINREEWPAFSNFRQLCENYPTLVDLLRLTTHIYGTELSPLDPLDRLSAIAGTEYKDYDFNQILLLPLHQIQTMICQKQLILNDCKTFSEEDRNRAQNEQAMYRKTLSELHAALSEYRNSSLFPSNPYIIAERYQNLLQAIEEEIKRCQ